MYWDSDNFQLSAQGEQTKYLARASRTVVTQEPTRSTEDVVVLCRSVMYDFLRSHTLWPTRLLSVDGALGRTLACVIGRWGLC